MRALRHSCKPRPEFLHCSLWWFEFVLRSGISKRAVYRLLVGWLRALGESLGRDRGAWNRAVCGAGRAAPAVPRDICDLSGQLESLQLFLYSCDLGRRREGKGRAFSSPLAFPKK